ncbi:MAG: hypothetical protein U1E11_00805, partial [Dethiobacteria bacterium]|nr:hypothetical protein [Dethiobacteria bacterium]
MSEMRVGRKEQKPQRSNKAIQGRKLSPVTASAVLIGLLLITTAIFGPLPFASGKGSLSAGQKGFSFSTYVTVSAQQEAEAEAEVDDEIETILIGVLANRGPELCLTEWGPTAAYLSEQLYPLRFEIVPLDFDQIYLAVTERKVNYIAANPSYYAFLEFNG